MSTGEAGKSFLVRRTAGKFVGQMEDFDVLAGPASLKFVEPASELQCKVFIEVEPHAAS